MNSTKLTSIYKETKKTDEGLATAGLTGYLTGALGAFLLNIFGKDKKDQVEKMQDKFEDYIQTKLKTDPEFKQILDKIQSGEVSLNNL